MTEDAKLCAACETPLQGRYCHACGQDSRAKPAPLREMAVQVATSYSPIDGKLARTLAVLAIRPGRLLEAYRSGAGSLYVTPLKLFVAATALFLSVLNFSNTTFFQYTWKVDEPGAPVRAVFDPETLEVTVDGATERDRWLQPRIEPAVDPEVTAAIELGARTEPTEAGRANMVYELTMDAEQERLAARFSEWLPNVLWLLMPLYAVGLIPLFGRRRLFFEHVLFAMWAHAITFVMAMGIAAINARGANLSALWLALPYLAYFTVAASRYYGVSTAKALWRGLLHLTYYLFIVLLPVALVILLTVMDWNAFWTYFQSP